MGKTINLFIFSLLTIAYGCRNNTNQMQSLQLDKNSKRVRDYVVENAVIAHRGTTSVDPMAIARRSFLHQSAYGMGGIALAKESGVV